MKQKDMILNASIPVFLLAAYYGITIVCLVAVAAFFWELGKQRGAEIQLSELQQKNERSANSQSVTPDEGR